MTANEALEKAKVIAVERDEAVYVAPDPFGEDGEYCPWIQWVSDWGAKCYPGGRVELMPDFAKLVEVQK